jgi:hypothetical protein
LGDQISRDGLQAVAFRINERETQIRSMLNKSVHLAALTGRDLIQVKSGLRRGEFVPWLLENCRLSRSKSNEYMRLFRENPEFVDPEKCPLNVSASALVELQYAPDDVRELAGEAIVAGELVTKKLIRELSRPASKPAAKKERPEAWFFVDHVCRHCCGRLLRRKVSPIVTEVICAKCETRSRGSVESLCWCGKNVGTHGKIFECIKNPNPRQELPNVVMVRERSALPKPQPVRPSRYVGGGDALI